MPSVKATTVRDPSPSILRPPGGLAVWLFILVELTTFGAAMIVFLVQRSADVAGFEAARSQLNSLSGAINTLILITSGFAVAQGVASYQRGNLRESARRLSIGAWLGLAFLGIKLVEYRNGWVNGHGPGDGDFFTYYWGLTGFHFLHVCIGVFLLFAIAMKLKKGERFEEEDAGVEAGAAFWHMCDLIWILLFPLLYVLK